MQSEYFYMAFMVFLWLNCQEVDHLIFHYQFQKGLFKISINYLLYYLLAILPYFSPNTPKTIYISSFIRLYRSTQQQPRTEISGTWIPSQYNSHLGLLEMLKTCSKVYIDVQGRIESVMGVNDEDVIAQSVICVYGWNFGYWEQNLVVFPDYLS